MSEPAFEDFGAADRQAFEMNEPPEGFHSLLGHAERTLDSQPLDVLEMAELLH